MRPVIKWAFGRLRRKTASQGREDTRVWYRETMFSQMVSDEFLLHGALHGYFLYLVCAPVGVANLKKAGRDPFNQNSNLSDREKWSTSKGGPVVSKLFQLDRTDPLSFGPKFPEILVEWIAPYLRCSKRFDHGSHSIIFLLFEFKSVRWLDDVGARKLREMLALHSNQHAVHGRFTLKDWKDDCERQVWNAVAASWTIDRCSTWADRKSVV